MEELQKAIEAGKKPRHLRGLINRDENLKSFLGTAEVYPRYCPLHNAVAKDRWDLAKLLIQEFGVRPNALCKYTDGDRATALHIAVFFGSRKCLAGLLAELGRVVNPNLVGMFEGCFGTAAEMAAQRNSK